MNGSGLRVQCLASTRPLAWTSARGEEEEKVVEKVETEELAFRVHRVPLEKPEAILSEEEESDDDSQESSLSGSASSSDSSSEDDDSQVDNDDFPENRGTRHISCIQDAQLSPDGTCIFTSDYSRTFSVYPIDSTLSAEASIRQLTPYASFTSPNPIWTFAASPLFNLQDASTTHVLVSRRDSYITLHNALWDITRTYEAEESHASKAGPVDMSKPITFYKLVNHLTEAVTAPLSLAYSHNGAHFFAGTQNSIATFDISQTEDPIHTIATIPSTRNKLKGGGRGFKGWISALSLSPASPSATGGLLAAGSRTRYVGIYDAISGTEVTHISLPGTIDGKKIRNEHLQHIMGDGVSQLKWSPCGKYLYVAERMSDALLIYDVRNFSLSLAHCTGRTALTKQKLGFDVWNAGASPYDIEGVSHEIWAGGTDGNVRVWRDPYVKEGAVEADEVVRVHEGHVSVVSTLVHPSGGLAVAASGKVDLGHEVGVEGKRRGGGMMPKFSEWGRLDTLGLG